MNAFVIQVTGMKCSQPSNADLSPAQLGLEPLQNFSGGCRSLVVDSLHGPFQIRDIL